NFFVQSSSCTGMGILAKRVAAARLRNVVGGWIDCSHGPTSRTGVGNAKHKRLHSRGNASLRSIYLSRRLGQALFRGTADGANQDDQQCADRAEEKGREPPEKTGAALGLS